MDVDKIKHYLKYLKEFGVMAMHYNTLGKPDNVQKIAKAVF